MADPADDIQSLAAAVRAGDRRKLARAISHVENRLPGYRELLARLHRDTGHSFRVGITGPPGAGKSTLVDGLAARWAAEGARVGIVAVDPTSPFTGGALLGDRVRMADLSSVEGVYIRSMATRGSTGGVAAATADVLRVLDAFGFDWLIVETVGVGQIEIEIMNVCDSVAVVFVPESGDGIQALKAGLIEIAHLFVINKADRPGAPQLAAELDHVMASRRVPDGWSYPVITTEAPARRGVPEFGAALAQHREYLLAGGRLEDVRRRQARADLENVLRERLHAYLQPGAGSSPWVERLVEQVAGGDLEPHRAAEIVWDRIREQGMDPADGV